jgi:hypothetical protein
MICLVRTGLIFGIWLFLLRDIWPLLPCHRVQPRSGSSWKVMICSIRGSNWDWQFLHALQGMHHLFWMAGILWPLRHMQWQQSAERWTESMLRGMMSLFDFANHIPSIPGCMQKEK